MRQIALGLIILLLGDAGSARCSTPVKSVETFLASFTRREGTLDYKGLWGSIGVRSKLFLEAPSATIAALTVGGEPWKLVKLSDDWKNSWQYLAFRRQEAGTWAFAGSVDFADTHYEEPTLRSATIDAHSWFILRHVQQYGTGLFVREEAWYPVAGHIGKCDLRYMAQGNFTENKHGVDYLSSYEEIGLATEVTNGNPVVVVSHRVTRSILGADNLETDLTRAEVATRFSWSQTTKRFRPIGVRRGSLNERVVFY